jgi:hypothetical protein
MAKQDYLKKFSSEYQPEKNGRPKGSKNRSTLVRQWLEASESIVNPITGEKERLTQQDIMTLAIIKKARKGDVAAYKELMDSAHGKVTDHTDITTNGNSVNIPVIKWAGENEGGENT